MVDTLTTASYDDYLASVDEIIEDVQKGKMIILIDEEDRENEGDLIIPAEKATPEAVNFMAKHGRGLICLALTESRCDELGLELMTRKNQSRHETAFTVSIEAREGVTTGISAADRAQTIRVAIDPTKEREDIGSPGHVFPLMAREGGVLVRTGHTEAAVDIARLAGMNPSGVICEIMNDDGTMARLPDLIQFAQLHDLKLARISDLIAHRRHNEQMVHCAVTRPLKSVHGGDWNVSVYTNSVDGAEHIALVKGDIRGTDPVLVRVHPFNIVNDLLGEVSARGGVLYASMRQIGEAGRGVVVIIQEAQTTSMVDRIRFELGEDAPGPLRDYGVGAQILRDIGVCNMILLTNKPRPVVGLEGYGLSIVERRSIDGVQHAS